MPSRVATEPVAAFGRSSANFAEGHSANDARSCYPPTRPRTPQGARWAMKPATRTTSARGWATSRSRCRSGPWTSSTASVVIPTRLPDGCDSRGDLDGMGLADDSPQAQAIREGLGRERQNAFLSALEGIADFLQYFIPGWGEVKGIANFLKPWANTRRRRPRRRLRPERGPKSHPGRGLRRRRRGSVCCPAVVQKVLAPFARRPSPACARSGIWSVRRPTLRPVGAKTSRRVWPRRGGDRR